MIGDPAQGLPSADTGSKSSMPQPEVSFLYFDRAPAPLENKTVRGKVAVPAFEPPRKGVVVKPIFLRNALETAPLISEKAQWCRRPSVLTTRTTPLVERTQRNHGPLAQPGTGRPVFFSGGFIEVAFRFEKVAVLWPLKNGFIVASITFYIKGNPDELKSLFWVPASLRKEFDQPQKLAALWKKAGLEGPGWSSSLCRFSPTCRINNDDSVGKKISRRFRSRP